MGTDKIMRHIIPISGKDSLATALVQIKRQPDIDYEFMFNPTGAELPDVFEWIDKVEKYLGKQIVRVGENLEEIIEEKNYFIPSANRRYCTYDSKIQPMEKWIGKDECTIYYGIRVDEKRTGYQNASGRITICLPLVEENIDINKVYQIVTDHELKPPTFFWQQLYDEVSIRIGEKVIKTLLKQWQMDMLFAWRSRANCYFCHFQRQYEWVGLSHFYPELFWNAEAIEHKGTSINKFTWNSNRSLQYIFDNRDSIFKSRVKAVCKIINDLNSGIINFDKEDVINDILSIVSCGLFCGK